MRLFVLYAMCFLSAVSHADDSDWTHYTTENSGLRCDSIYSIHIDEDGMKWISYQDNGSLSGFDGETWQRYDFDNVRTIFSSRVIRGELWVCTLLRGVQRVRDNGIEIHYDGFDIHDVAAGPDDMVWIRGGISHFNNGGKYAIARYDGHNWIAWNVLGPNSFTVDKDGVLWMLQSREIISYDGAVWRRYHQSGSTGIEIKTGTDNIKWLTVVNDQSNHLFRSLRSIEGDVMKEYPGTVARQLAIGSDGMIWTLDRNVIGKYDGTYYREWDIPIDTDRYGFRSLAADRDGSVWIGSFSVGIVHFTGGDTGGNPVRIEPVVISQDINTIQNVSGNLTGNEYFPVAMGNKWVYRRTMKSIWSDIIYYDHVINEIIDTSEYDGNTYFGTVSSSTQYAFGPDGKLISPAPELRPCGEIECVDGIYYTSDLKRREVTVEVPAGMFTGYEFTSGIGHGCITVISPGIGYVYRSAWPDSMGIDKRELEYAYINGVEIGVKTGVTSVPAPLTFDLGSPFPNPFNMTTTLEFTLQETAPVRLDVFNIAGQKVRTLVDGALPPGKHMAQWDGSDGRGVTTASGIYIVRLTCGERSVSRALAFVK